MKLTGLIVVRNYKTLDYMPIEAARSLIPLCNEVVIADMDSDDGSSEELMEFAKTDSRVRLESMRWLRPFNNPHWWTAALNTARILFVDPDSYLLQLDADELVGPESKRGIEMALADRSSAFFKRFNFWKDQRHLAPHNRCCGTMVARMGPAHLYLPSDEPHPAASPNIREGAQSYPELNIYHYGFLRRKDAFLLKSEVVQNCFFGSVDSRLLDAKAKGLAWDDVDYFEGEPLELFAGSHPKEAHQWLKDRGFAL
jgi:hypothetical protein